MKFDIALDSAHFFEFLFGTHNVNFAAVLANPDRKRSSPVSLAGKPPVDNVLEEVAHSARTYGFGHPVHRFVRGDELIFYRGGFDEPTRSRVIYKRSVTSPAERITMLEKYVFEQFSAFFKIFDDEFIRVFDEHSLIRLYRVHESATVVYHLNEWQIVLSSHVRVVLAERRGDMNYSRAVGQGNVIVVGDVKRFLSERSESVREHRLVFDVFVILAFLFRNDFVVLEERGNESLGKNVNFVADLDFDVIETGVHTERDVGGQSPGSGCPHEKISVISALDFKFHVNGFFLYVFVSLRHFVRRKRRSATRAIRNDFMPLIKQTFFGNGF